MGTNFLTLIVLTGKSHNRWTQVHSTHQHTILVVEDEILIRLMIAEASRDVGFGVVEAGTAEGALAILEKDASVELVFADVWMPGTMDGIAWLACCEKPVQT